MVKKLILLLVAFTLAGCDPRPYAQSCPMPDFGGASASSVNETFSTWGYFSERCPTAIPKEFEVRHAATTLKVRVDGEWLRLSAKDRSGAPMRLDGPTLRHGGKDARFDDQTGGVFEVDVVSPAGVSLDRFVLPFKPLTCTCVTYDAV